MPWTTPFTATPGNVISSTQHNTGVRDNLAYLFSGRPANNIHRVGTYSTTSTAYVAVDTTNVRVTASIASTRWLVMATGRWLGSAAAAILELDLLLDSTTYGSGSMARLLYQNSGTTGGMYTTFCIAHIFTGLSVGSHYVDLVYRVNSGYTANLYDPSLITVEV